MNEQLRALAPQDEVAPRKISRPVNMVLRVNTACINCKILLNAVDLNYR